MALVNFSLGDIGSLVKDLRTAITGEISPDKQAELQAELIKLETALKQGQIEIGKEEAKSPNWWVAGARPFILWICGFAIAYHFIISPFLYSFFYVFDIKFPLPQLDIGVLFNLLVSMLGLAGLRTYEKLKGVNGNHD